MSSFFYNMAFHRGGKPRKWLVFLLVTGRMIVRPMLLPFEVTTKSWRGRPGPINLLSRNTLAAQFNLEPSGASTKLIISISHDDYIKTLGGVQLCIQREQALAAEQGFRYLQIHPRHPLPRLAHVDEEPDTIIALILDGKGIGTCRMSTLVGVTQKMIATSVDVNVVVHHLMGHLPEQVAELVLATGSGRCVFWLHDFFSICLSYTLQRNNLAFCSGPPITSNACMSCVYGTERTMHQKRMQEFFKSLSVDVASPSAVTAEFWQAKSDLEAASISVLPHMTLDIVPRACPTTNQGDRPITVGYLGAPDRHKGWPTFKNLMNKHSGSGTYRFVVMSSKRPRLGEEAWVSVHVTADNPTAMSDAVAAEDVDIVLHWPTWPETFSFTTFEALAGSAYVITNPGSGNVAAAVKQTGRGAILTEEADLFAFFHGGLAKAMAARRREAKRNFEILLRHSNMSFPLIRND